MKKKILICLKNPFAIDNLLLEIRLLSKSFDITLLTTNYLLNNNLKKKYKQYKEMKYIKSVNYIPYFSNRLSRSIKTIIFTHVFLKKLQKQINFKNFDICFSDNKFDIWQRIIFENFISKKCIQVGLTVDAVLIPLEDFKKLISGDDVMKIVKNLHKLRQDKKIKNKKTSYLNRFQNFINRQKDILLDRRIISKIFYGKEFNHKELDFNLLETDKFDYKLSFFYSSYYFWNKIYKKNSFLINLKNDCTCDESSVNKKNKAIFISTLWSEYKKHEYPINEKIQNISTFFQLLREKNPHLNQLDFRFHPEEDEQVKKSIKKEIINQNLNFINFMENNINLNELSCNYSNAFGALSGALVYLKKFCNNIEVYCLRSLSEEIYGEYYYLKMINEGVIHYDDINNIYINNQQFINKKELDVKRYNLDEFIFSILN
tara:strand:+ start:661 stop:1950 length:1290 start_codon:yes stop_codon:yes gene_type:complete